MWVTGQEKIVDKVRQGLNQSKLFDTAVARLYIYSTKDKLIDWKDVEEHAHDAEAVGYKTTLVKYLDSGHTAHLMSDEKRYWGAVTALWDSGYLSSNGSIKDAW